MFSYHQEKGFLPYELFTENKEILVGERTHNPICSPDNKTMENFKISNKFSFFGSRKNKQESQEAFTS